MDVDKSELLARLHTGYTQVHGLIAPLTPSQLQTGGVIDGWSIKDLIAHFIAHEQFALHEIAAAQRGEHFHHPYHDTDAMNAAIVAHYADTSPEQVLCDWERSFGQVIALVEGLTDAEFHASGAVVQLLGDTIDGALANNTYEHYAEHMPTLLAWLSQGEGSVADGNARSVP
jgi:hypothetical protein